MEPRHTYNPWDKQKEVWQEYRMTLEVAVANATNWLVSVHYSTCTSQYQVLGAADAEQAEDTVLRYIGYNPGVPMSAVPMKGLTVGRNYPIVRYHPDLP
jgi:hypothetical protein